MDPVSALGVAGSVVGIAGFGIQLSQILIKFISKVRSAQEHLEYVVEEIDLTTSALEDIYGFLKQEAQNVKTGRPLELFSQSSLIKVKDTADKCLVAFWYIEIIIAGSEPDGFKDEVKDRLNSLNQMFESYHPDRPIEIKPQLPSDPLRSWDKFLWGFRASKLEKYCKQLQRNQDHLVLLLQIVLLGQHQAKQKKTNRDITYINQTYAFISQIATPEELRSMALEAQEERERLRGRSRRQVNSRVYGQLERSKIQAPTRQASSRTVSISEPERPQHFQPESNPVNWNTGTKHRRSTSPPESLPAPFFHSTREIPNGHVTSFLEEAHASNGVSLHSRTALPVKLPITPSEGRQNEDNPRALDTNSGKHASDNSAHEQTTTHNHTPNINSSSAQADSPVNTADKNITGPEVGGPSSVVTPNENSHDEEPALNPSNVESEAHQNPKLLAQDAADESNTEALPYVIQEEGAYRLPTSLQLPRKDKNSVLSEQTLAMELAFLSPGQLNSLQRLLQHHSEAKPHKLVRLEVARKPARKFWQRQRRVTVAFIEGDVSNMPELLLPQGDQSAQQVDQGRLLSRTGLPKFQDVTGDVIDEMRISRGQAVDVERFTEYRMWQIEPYSALQIGGRSAQDWTRSLLKEEDLPRVEIRRRLRILDKDQSTMIEKTATLTVTQQFQVWRSVEAAKMGDPDPDCHWSIRQLEIIRSRRLFITKQIKAIIVYVSKAPRQYEMANTNVHPRTPSWHLGKSKLNTTLAPQGIVYHDVPSEKMMERELQGPTSSAGRTSFSSVEIRASPTGQQGNRQTTGRKEIIVGSRAAAEVSKHHEEAIALANRLIADRPRRPKPSPTRSQPFHGIDDYHHTRKHELARTRERDRDRDRDRGFELDREIRRLEGQINQTEREREVQLEQEIQRLKSHINRTRGIEEENEQRSQIAPRISPRMILQARNARNGADWEQVRTRDDEDLINQRREVKSIEPEFNNRLIATSRRLRDVPDEDRHRNRSSVRFVERNRSETPLQLTYDNESSAREERARYPSQFDRRRFDSRASSRSMAENQNAVKQLLLEWTPAYISDEDSEDSTTSTAYGKGDSDSDTHPEEYVMAEEEFPVLEPSSTWQREQAESTQSAVKMDVNLANIQGEEPDVNNLPSPTKSSTRGSQERLKQDGEKGAQEGFISRGSATSWRARLGLISSSPQQLSRPSSKNTNDENGINERPQRDTPRTSVLKELATQNTNDNTRPFHKGKNIARAATLPQASRQPWSDEDWARRIVEETAATVDDKTGLDRVAGRRASFHFLSSRSRGPELRTERRGGNLEMQTESPRLAAENGVEDIAKPTHRPHGSFPSTAPRPFPSRRRTLI
ncbi:hypothetical protein GGS24DRAFT_237698 [Hypoxylon argillaceum]|nr:hypothetical protein GGS24DRAFT_237698 [Hypoxylon argillaceum]